MANLLLRMDGAKYARGVRPLRRRAIAIEAEGS